MNIISVIKYHILLALAAALFGAAVNVLPVYSQENTKSKLFDIITAEKDSVFSLNFEIGGGYTARSIEATRDIKSWGLTPLARFLWKPDNLLNIGLQSAVLHIQKTDVEDIDTEFGKTDLKASLNAIPIMIVFNMKLWIFDVYGGMGTSYVWANMNSFDIAVKSSEWHHTFFWGVSWSYYFADYFGIGLEGNTHYFSALDKNVSGLMLKIHFDVFRW